MDPKHWQEQLIGLFCYLSQAYHTELWVQVARLSPAEAREALRGREGVEEDECVREKRSLALSS